MNQKPHVQHCPNCRGPKRPGAGECLYCGTTFTGTKEQIAKFVSILVLLAAMAVTWAAIAKYRPAATDASASSRPAVPQTFTLAAEIASAPSSVGTE